MRVTIRPYKNIDWFTVIVFALLVIFGWLNIYAANYDPEIETRLSLNSEAGKQLLWIGLSLVMIGVLFFIDSKFFVEFAYIFYGVSILLLLFALFFGKEINGAKAWFEIGAIRFQPAELAKVTAGLALARVMSRYNFKMSNFRYVLKTGFILILPVMIIILQNDAGSALVYAAFFLVFFREGMSPVVLFLGLLAAIVFVFSLLYETIFISAGLFVVFTFYIFLIRRRKTAASAFLLAVAGFGVSYGILIATGSEPDYMLPFLVGTLIASTYLLLMSLIKRVPHLAMALLVFWGMIGFTYSTHFLFDDILSNYQKNRVLVMLGLEDDPLGVGYNVNQSKIAIGSGGFQGKGYLQGTQTKYDFVPEQSTDFIFCTVGEEWGFLGTSAVVVLFLLLFYRIIYLAERQHSNFSRIYGYAVMAIFFMHFVINVGMTIGLAPVIGIPLPFFSYGGSSFWGFTILLFIFLKLDTNRAELIR
ncbi:MAG: rod shape-determining protein RodA [Marinilabiliaceae bacterium]